MSYSDLEFNEVVVDEYYKLDENKKMENGIFKLSWVHIKSALVHGVLWGLLIVGMQVIEIGNVFALDWRALLNAGVLAFLGAVVSLLKNMLTTNKGNFVGVVEVVE